jgi:hypothetical protein
VTFPEGAKNTDPLSPRAEGSPNVTQDQHAMPLAINDTEITAAVRLDHLCCVTGWPWLLSRNEAIMALMLAGRRKGATRKAAKPSQRQKLPNPSAETWDLAEHRVHHGRQ